MLQLYCTRDQVEATNIARMAELPDKPHVFTGKATGPEALLSSFLKNVPAPPTISLKTGAKVLLVTNLDVAHGMVNGSRGTIVSWSEGLPLVEFPMDDGKVMRQLIGRARWALEERGVELASYVQMPLIPAYALTIHKVQGMTINEGRVQISKAFAPGQLYVAISRFRNLEGLYLESPVISRYIFTDKRASDYYKNNIK